MNLKELVSPERREKGLWWQRAWSLVEGCTPVSEACQKCWAAAQAHMRKHQKNSKIMQRYSGLTTSEGKWNGKIRWLHDNLDLPRKVKKPTLFSIWNDLMHPDVTPLMVKLAIEVIRECKQHFFLLLTKRPERALDHFCHNVMFMKTSQDSFKQVPDLPPNLGIGTTVELPEYLHRIGTLLKIPAALHFVSLEPLLGEVSLKPYLPGLHWVILGCESGGHRRDTKIEWAEKIVEECRDAGVPVFVKQLDFTGAEVVKAPELSGRQFLEFPEVEWKP